MSQDTPLKVGLIGTGIFAHTRHLPAISAVPELKLTACANRTIEKAQEFASKSSIPHDKVYADITALLADPDVEAIDALLPAQYTLDAVNQCVAAGKPIAIEKPIAANLAQAKEIVRISRESELPIMVLENFAFWHIVDEIKAVLSQIGDVVYFSHYAVAPFNPNNIYLNTSWRQKPEHVGGFLSDGGVHQVAIFTEILGEVESLSALTTQVQDQSGDVDTLTSTLKMKSGVLGSFTYTSAVSVPRINKLTIHGTKGSIIYDFADKDNAKLTLFTPDEPSGKSLAVERNEQEGVPAEFKNFAEAVRAKDKSLLKVPCEKGFHHFAVICAAVESGKQDGTSVKVAVP
ncbi:hypothetical protein BZA70DRAFT_286866 [Myxozyma melibiosi]|uniref:NAD(P)-binding protein n=1 Tax=Myxozyma melibiosi TaxID=54550 RepID=A0ABR1FCE8_9ASCO